MTTTDTKTGLLNAVAWEQVAKHEVSRARRNGSSVAVLIVDIDRFKLVNDTYGHQAGDLVLVEFAERLTHGLRAGDIAGRWGGEEFLLILPRTGMTDAVQVAERIRIATAELPIPAGDQSIAITVSGGCAVGPVAVPGDLVKAADAGLYRAKAGGRNQIVSISVPA